ncbi:hypothetical protein DIPPA_31954 [Diplonema papillatum]|nr:hypothetical protein DIPPA_31954 [Diplonema papillatum]
MARDDASALSRWIVPDEDVDDGTFEGVMWRIPGHNARMRAAAALAKERSPLAAAQLARAKNDPRAVDAWLGIYTVVAAMAQGSADVLVALIRRSESTIVRARAVQALAKVDQVALYRVISDEATPAQLKGIGMKLLCLAGPPEDGRCDAFITVVLAEPTWGGYWQAVLLLQRLPRGEQTERVLEHWLPIVSKLASSVPKPKAARLHAYSSRADLEAVWQSVSIKHPRLFLRILEREAKFDFRYYPRGTGHLVQGGSVTSPMRAGCRMDAGNCTFLYHRHTPWVLPGYAQSGGFETWGTCQLDFGGQCRSRTFFFMVCRAAICPPPG